MDYFPIFTIVIQFLSHFRSTSCIRMLKRFNKEHFHCPVVSCEKINAVFYEKYASNLHRKRQSSKIARFSTLLNFVTISIDLVDNDVKTVQQGKKLLSSRLLSRDSSSL